MARRAVLPDVQDRPTRPTDVPHKREAIEADLTVVFAALAIARHLQSATGLSVKRLVTTLRPLREITITIAGHTITADPKVPADVQGLIDRMTHKPVQVRAGRATSTPSTHRHCYLHTVIDDHSRLAYVEAREDETKDTATGF